jgi:hypothetical protein
VVDSPRMPLQSPDHLAFQIWLASPKETRWLRDFCVIQWCFVVLLGEFATDIPRAWLLKINDFQTSKFPNFLSLRASNQVVGSSNLSGRAIFTENCCRSSTCPNNQSLIRTADRQQDGFDDSAARRRWRLPFRATPDVPPLSVAG